MKKLLLILLLLIIIIINVNARPEIPIKNGGNCSEFVYLKVLQKYGIDLPIKNSSESEWLSLKNKYVEGRNKIYKIRFTNTPRKNSLQLLTAKHYSELLGVKSYLGHIRFVDGVAYNKNDDNYIILTEESSLNTLEDTSNYNTLDNIWFKQSFYTYKKDKNIIYIFFQFKQELKEIFYEKNNRHQNTYICSYLNGYNYSYWN